MKEDTTMTYIDALRHKKIKVVKIGNKDNIFYSTDEICPICGAYTTDGSVCVCCQKEYGVYEPKNTYSEGVNDVL